MVYYYILAKQVVYELLLITLFIYSEIRKVVESNPNKNFWIGFERTQAKWSFASNDEDVDFDEIIFKWKAGEPNNMGGNEDCVHLWERSELNDLPCSNWNELWGKPIHGLCEIGHC